MDDTFIMNGRIFLNELFDGIRPLQDKLANRAQIEEFVTKSGAIFEFFGMKYSFQSLGKLTIENRRLESLKEVEQLSTDVVFNCMGVFSKQIFKDDNLVGMKGSMFYYKNTTNMRDVYQVDLGPKDELLIMPYRDVIAMGVTKDPGPIDIREDRVIMKRLKDNLESFFKPKL